MQARDYLRSGRLLSLVYVLGIVAQYFYDPKLALPRSLVWSAWLLLGFLRGRRQFTDLERWQTRYIPVYAVWAAIVVAVFPPLFGFG